MAWIELHQPLRKHPKLIHAASLLGMEDRDLLRAKLENLWLDAVDYFPSGVLPDNPAVVATMADWKGDPGAFTQALVASGWLDAIPEGGYQIHDWEQYAGRLITYKAKEAERLRSIRTNSVRTPYVRRTDSVRTPDVQRTYAVTVPVPVPVPGNVTNVVEIGADAPNPLAVEILGKLPIAGSAETPPDASESTGTTPDTTQPDCVDSSPVSGLPERSSGASASPSEACKRVIEAWNEAFGTRITMTDGRVAKVKARLKRWTVEQMVKAVENLSKSAWHRGENDRNWTPPGPEFILRSDDKLEEWLLKQPTEKDKGVDW